jgi:hypothetical protein
VRTRRPAASHIAAALTTAAALTLATCPPSEAATSTGWQVVFQGPFSSQPSFETLYSVSAPTKASAWAVGAGSLSIGGQSTPVAVQWNGTSWQPSALPAGLSGTLGAVSAPASNDVWATSQLNGYVLHWNGTAWAVAKSWKESVHNPRELTGVTAFSPADVWVFGTSGFGPGLGTWHLSGGVWTKVTGPGGRITMASALSPASMWAVGSSRTASDDIIVRYNGTSWRRVRSPALSGLQFISVLAVSATDVWATGSVSGRLVPRLLHFDGQHWSSVPVTAPKAVKQLGNLASDGRGGLWINGFGASRASWVLHYSAAGTWSSDKLVTTPIGGVWDLALIPGTASLWGVGSLGTTASSDGVVWGRGPAA